ncbi:hypothetical protein ISS85_00985 [Candidatus Microgenomates bacterium]|nr:hypothetical protein [Candidatus Microgenomates bacterium]
MKLKVLLLFLWYLFGIAVATIPLLFGWNFRYSALSSYQSLLFFTFYFLLIGLLDGVVIFAFSEKSFSEKKPRMVLGLLLFFTIGFIPPALTIPERVRFELSDKGKVELGTCSEEMYLRREGDEMNTLTISCKVSLTQPGLYRVDASIFDRDNKKIGDFSESGGNLSVYWNSRRTRSPDLEAGEHKIIIDACGICLASGLTPKRISSQGPYRLALRFSRIVVRPWGESRMEQIANFENAYITKTYVSFEDFTKKRSLGRTEEQAKQYDQQKQTDIDKVAGLLEDYKAKNGKYPVYPQRVGVSSNYSSMMKLDFEFQSESFPKDPEEFVRYKYFSNANGTKAVLWAELSSDENKDGDFTNDLYVYFPECGRSFYLIKASSELAVMDLRTSEICP